jgi:branched-chain amino acid transport system substrate-binding protein
VDVRITRFGAVACAVVTVAGLSACGSSSNSNSDGPALAGGASTSAPVSTAKGAPIVVGTICSCSGPQSAVLAAAGQINQSWANSVNAAGGLNGHPVKMIVMDDGQDPATALQDAKALVQQDHVMAVVGEASTADASFASYLASKGVPVVGGSSPEPTFLTNPDYFVSGSDLLGLVAGTIALPRRAGKRDLGIVYCAESPVCAQLVPLATGIGKLDGIKTTPDKISATAPNYTAPCLSQKQAGVDAVFIADNGPIVQRFVASCAQEGFRPTVVGQTSTSTPAWLSDANFNGTLLAAANANPYDTSLPTIKRMQNAVEQSFPGLVGSDEFTFDMVLPWSGDMLFEAAAKTGHLTPDSTPADVKKALYSLKNETLGGLTAPLTFTPGKSTITPCWFTERIESGEFDSLNADKPTCLTAPQAAALARAFKSR